MSEILITGLTELMPLAMNKKELRIAWFSLWKGDCCEVPYINFQGFDDNSKGGVYRLGLLGINHYIEYSTNTSWSPHTINIKTNNTYFTQRFLKFYLCYCNRTNKGS